MILKPYDFLNSNNYLTKPRKPFEKKIKIKIKMKLIKKTKLLFKLLIIFQNVFDGIKQRGVVW